MPDRITTPRFFVECLARTCRYGKYFGSCAFNSDVAVSLYHIVPKVRERIFDRIQILKALQY